MSDYTEKSAVISDCGKYRDELRRVWDAALPILYWVMLNPSTADAMEDDPTIRKCVGFAKMNGFGGIIVLNLSTYRATDPKQLIAMRGHVNVIGPNADSVLAAIPRGATVVCAWGAFPDSQPSWHTRPIIVKRLLEGCVLRCVKITKSQPWHPLYVPYGELKDLP